MASQIIRSVSNYVVSTNGKSILLNGAQAKLHPAESGSRDGSPFLLFAEGNFDINGKFDLISITEAEYAIHVAARAVQKFGDVHPSDIAAELAFDVVNNEGGEGYNPHRSGSERSYVRDHRADRRYPANA